MTSSHLYGAKSGSLHTCKSRSFEKKRSVLKYFMPNKNDDLQLLLGTCFESDKLFALLWIIICNLTVGFLTPDSFHSTSIATWGSSWAPKEAKFIRKFDFLGFSCYFSARIEQSSKTSKIQPNCVILGWFLKFVQF